MLTHAHKIATKQRHNKQSFSLGLKLKHYIVASIMGPREPENKRRRAPEHPLETDQQRRARPHERNEREGEQSQRNREKQD